jgi:hypothetical protein
MIGGTNETQHRVPVPGVSGLAYRRMSVTSRTLRTVGAVGAALVAFALAVGPASAETVKSTSGNIGPYEIFDTSSTPGANCLYETASFDLDRISVRPPAHVHSYGSSSQWVGWRYVIGRDAHQNGYWKTYYQSPIVKQYVNDNTNPSSFARRTWIAPEHPTGRFRVRIVIYWYTHSSRTHVTGKTVIEYDYYKAKWNGNSQPHTEYCLEDY